MPELRSLARITRRGGSATPTGVTIQRNDVEDSLETKCWLIYTAMMEKASRKGASWSKPQTDEDGRILSVDALKNHARDLYPLACDWSDPVASGDFMKPIYKYLRSTGNARIVQRNPGGDPSKALWSLAPEWSTEFASVAAKATFTPTRREKKVTPTEAGEDREPSPVVVVVRPKEDAVPKKNRGKVSNDDFKVVEGGFQCPQPGCGDVRATIHAARGHYGAKHNQPEKFTKSESPRPARQVAVADGSPMKGIRTKDKNYPWMCPVEGCGQKFKAFQGIGGHLSKHNNEAREAEVETLKAEVETLKQKVQGKISAKEALIVLADAINTPQVDSAALNAVQTRLEAAQMDIKRLAQKEQDLLKIISDQQERLDKMTKMINAITGS